MRELKKRTDGLLLLTATPMQVHPVEVWDLLSLLGLPPEWTAAAFLQFFEDVVHPNPSAPAMDRMAALFQAAEREFGAVELGRAQGLMADLSRLKARKVLRALRDQSSIPRRPLENRERAAALALLRAHTPIRHLVSRHTRDLLRRYHSTGKLDTRIADRDVRDEFIELSATERSLYDEVEEYIGSTYNQAESSVRNAVGFVMTVYRRRLASSFQALGATLRKRVYAIRFPWRMWRRTCRTMSPQRMRRTRRKSRTWNAKRCWPKNVPMWRACSLPSKRCRRTASWPRSSRRWTNCAMTTTPK